MKKYLVFLVALVFAVSLFAMPRVFAQEQTATSDWIITEFGANQMGKEGNTNGYTEDVDEDCFEFIEIYNNSGRELDLYNYAITYSNARRETPEFENTVQRYTPFKPGDYLDDATLVPNTGIIGDLSNMPTNPDTCMVAPGEVVVLWMMYYDAYRAAFNDGKGMSIDDFRAHWGIPESVKVIAVDGNGNATNGGNPKNFNVINSGIGTYGIALQNDAMNDTANAPDGVLTGSYLDNPNMVFWATLDYENVILFGEPMDNQTINFTWDFGGYTLIDKAVTDYAFEEYTFDARRGYVLSACDQPTPGALNAIQKMTLDVELEEGESYAFSDECMYWPITGRKLLGFEINGELYEGEVTFTAPKAGKYEFDIFFEDESGATSEEPATEEVTEEVTEEITTEQVTETPANAETQAEQSKGGCGSVLTAALIPCLAVAASCIFKKRH